MNWKYTLDIYIRYIQCIGRCNLQGQREKNVTNIYIGDISLLLSINYNK